MTLGPLMIDLKGVAIEPDERDLLMHPLTGGVILFTRNYESPAQLTRLTVEIHALRSPALLVGVDHEGGRVQRFREGFTRLPALRAIGRRHAENPAAGVALARELGWLMAAELRGCGVDLSFAPCVDLDYGVSEVVGDRALHSRPERVAELRVACRWRSRIMPGGFPGAWRPINRPRCARRSKAHRGRREHHDQPVHQCGRSGKDRRLAHRGLFQGAGRAGRPR